MVISIICLQLLGALPLFALRPHQGSAPGPRRGTSVPSPPVLSPSETNFWLRPWRHIRTVCLQGAGVKLRYLALFNPRTAINCMHCMSTHDQLTLYCRFISLPLYPNCRHDNVTSPLRCTRPSQTRKHPDSANLRQAAILHSVLCHADITFDDSLSVGLPNLVQCFKPRSNN